VIAVLVLAPAAEPLHPPTFLTTAGNLVQHPGAGLGHRPVAVARPLSILTGGVDLAVGALTALAGAVAGHMMIKLGIDPYLASQQHLPLAPLWAFLTATWWLLSASLLYRDLGWPDLVARPGL